MCVESLVENLRNYLPFSPSYVSQFEHLWTYHPSCVQSRSDINRQFSDSDTCRLISNRVVIVTHARRRVSGAVLTCCLWVTEDRAFFAPSLPMPMMTTTMTTAGWMLDSCCYCCCYYRQPDNRSQANSTSIITDIPSTARRRRCRRRESSSGIKSLPRSPVPISISSVLDRDRSH